MRLDLLIGNLIVEKYKSVLYESAVRLVGCSPPGGLPNQGTKVGLFGGSDILPEPILILLAFLLLSFLPQASIHPLLSLLLFSSPLCIFHWSSQPPSARKFPPAESKR